MKQAEMTAKAANDYCTKNIPDMPDMHLAISTAFEAGAEWERENRWISVADSLPEDVVKVHKGTRYNGFTSHTDEVLVCTADGKVCTDYRFKENGVWKWEWIESSRGDKVEYWMPIPEPKKKGGEHGLE